MPNCHICNKPFTNTSIKHIDHSHIDGKSLTVYLFWYIFNIIITIVVGKVRGVAHSKCNMLFRESYRVPVVFHNFSRYDAHLIIEELAACIEGPLSVIGQNMETYISINKKVENTKIEFVFIDSFRFINTSLDKMGHILNNSSKKILRTHFPDDEDFQLICQKEVFPYDYVDSLEKLEEKHLPDKKHFYNKLTDSEISDENYERAQKVFRHFKCKNLGEYADLYLKIDVLLLADIFENFRDTLMATHTLDPAHFVSLPSYTWDCCLRYTGVELELLTDVDMLMFFERAVRGGMSQVSKRHAVANNEDLGLDDSKPQSYLLYLDVSIFFSPHLF